MIEIDKGLFILGEPIPTEIGDAHFFKLKDLTILEENNSMFQFDKDRLLSFIYFEMPDSHELFSSIFEGVSYVDMLYAFSGDSFKGTVFEQIFNANKTIFEYVFKYDVFGSVALTQEDYDYYFHLIAEMNRVKPFTINPNPRIRKRDLMRQKIEAKKGEAVSLESRMSSVALFMGFDAVRDMTIYQLDEMFGRIAKFDNYLVTRIASFLDPDIELISWAGDTHHENSKPKTITESEIKGGGAIEITPKQILQAEGK